AISGYQVGYLARIQGRALPEVITDHPQGETARMRRVSTDPPDVHRILPGRFDRHGVLGLDGVVDDDHARRAAQNLARFVGQHRPLELDVDGLGVADRHRHAHAGGAHAQVGQVEDLARLVDHLAFFAVQAVPLVAADLGDQVLMNLVGIDLARQLVTAHLRRRLRVQLVDRTPAGAGNGLIRVDHDALDRVDLMARPQGDHHLNGRAVRT